MPDPLQLAINLPFQEQIDFFRTKLNLPTERWDDIWKGAHDRAFVVAGAMKADLLDDLRKAVSPLQRTTLEQFRKDFKGIVAKHGWHGWTGEGTKAGEAWRTKVIYETNVRTSHAAGRYKQLTDPDTLAAMPYWRYVHNDSVMHPRQEHLAWHGITLRHDHPFWKTHVGPNGWGCRCGIVAQRQPGQGDKSKPPAGWDAIDSKTGEQVGIDKGWGYAPGASVAQEMRDLVAAKVAKLPPELGKALAADMASITKPVFAEQKTSKAAAKWAVDNNLADFADYTGVKPEVANEWNRSLFEHMQEFPELRKNQRFTGSGQAQNSRYVEVAVRNYTADLVAKGVPSDAAEAWARRRIKKPIIKGNRFAHSWAQPEAQGIAVNAKWGGAPDAFKARLSELEVSGWFPPGCGTIRSVVDHELGHQIDDLLGLSLDADIIKAYKEAITKGMINEVSGYAAHKNNPIAEFIAECWSESRNNPAPRHAARTVAAIARARYRSKFTP